MYMKTSGWFRPFLHSIRLLYGRIIHDGLMKEASALTYQSFLAIVPLLAVMFGIAKGFGLEQLLDRWLQQEFSDHQEVLSYLLRFSQTTLQEAQGGVIAGIGVFALLFTAGRLLSSIENALNGMWGIRYGRAPLRKLSHYLALLLTCPLLLAVSSSLTIFITTQLTLLTKAVPFLASAHYFFFTALSFAPFVLSALLFSVILYTMPSAPVRIIPACCSGCAAAVAFQFIQSWYILFQVRLTKISAVYGSFVALPLFLVWLWISWFLILLAGELLVFVQEKGWRPQILGYSDSSLEKLDTDVSIVAMSINYFENNSPLTVTDLFSAIPRPIRALTASLHRCKSQGYLLPGLFTHSSAMILPTKKAFSLSLTEIVFPPQPPIPSSIISADIVHILDTWKTTLKNNSLDRPVSHCVR